MTASFAVCGHVAGGTAPPAYVDELEAAVGVIVCAERQVRACEMVAADTVTLSRAQVTGRGWLSE